MALDREQLIALSKASAKACVNPSFNFAFEGETLDGNALQTTFAQQLNELGGTPQAFRENQNLIFTLLEVGLTEVIPAKVLQSYGSFADIKHYNDGDRPVFKVKISEASKKRARQFVTKVGIAGRYETFKLDGYSLTVNISAYGGAARIEWEEMVRGDITLNDYYNLVLEGMDETVYKEIAKALKQMVNDVPSANKTTQTQFIETEFDRMLRTADVYGHSTIYCTQEFAQTMIPMNGTAINYSALSDNMKEQVWNNGGFANYKGHTIVVLPQSFEDVDNAQKVIDPSYCYIIPNGAEKPVKIAFEGQAHVKSFENRDWSTEIQTYQKLGVATYLVNPGICVYRNCSLKMTNVAATAASGADWN